MEEPGYNKAAAVFISNDLIIQTVPVDKNGLIVSRLPTVQGIGAVYCTPSHQFPTGTVLPIGRRYELLKWAKETKKVYPFLLVGEFPNPPIEC